MSLFALPIICLMTVEKLRNFGEGTFIKNIGGTTYEVSTHYNPNGRETALNQFKKLILSERLF